jgi:hypothetical protein
MAGSLFHSCEFRIVQYMGRDGKQHHEVRPVDGDLEVVAYSSWKELKDFGRTHGIDNSEWPEFLEHPNTIDLPLSDIRVRSDRFRTAVAHFDRSADCPYWLARVLTYLDRGEQVFFC